MNEKLSILIVDDNRTNLALMDMLVRRLRNCTTQLQTDPRALLDGINRLDFDVAVLAGRLPQYGGIELAQKLKKEPRLRDRPILIAADEPDSGFRARALEAGVADVVAKPINPVEFRSRIVSLAGKPTPPAGPAASAREEEYLRLLVRIAGHRDRETPQHAQRVGRYSTIIAQHLGLPDEFCRDIQIAAALHDIGKSGLSDALLRKTGALLPEERRDMEEHTRIGHALLQGARSTMLRMAADIALTHHERWDGAGYPQGLYGEQIPLAGRIVAVADVFDALTSLRSYKTAWSLANAFSYLHDNAGEQFDPTCVAAFASGREEIAEVMRSMPDTDDNAADAA